MSNDHLPLELAVITDNAPGLQPEHIATHDQNMRRTGSIHFEYQQDRYRVRAWGDIFPDDGLGQYEGFLLRDKHTIFAAIENCPQGLAEERD